MRSYAVVAISALMLSAWQPAAAQAGLAGSWTTEFDIGIRNENGVETSMGKRQATMTLALKGDSVTGTWQPAGVDGGAPPSPVKLRGIRSGKMVTLQTEPVERTVRMNDDEQRVKMVTSYHFEARGDSLVGTTKVGALDGSFEGSDRSFVAKRTQP